ncbi:MAG: hypothetical protein QOJ07_1776 [Thermoleophilaceae bacterium]|nr:hypothetical protein [Thermoleophilaceae bacterium]
MSESGRQLREALDALSPGDRALLELSVQRGIDDKRLADMLGSDPDDVAQQRGRVLAELSVQLDGRAPADLERDIAALSVADAGVEAPAGEPSQEAVEDAAADLHGGEPRSERNQEARAGFLRSNSLSIFFLVIFLVALAGQSYAGWRGYDHDQHIHREAGITYARYLTSSAFANAVAENWQSEYLQFVLYIMATIWLVQRGSNESKRIRERGTESDEDQELGRYSRPDSPGLARLGGLPRALYSNSLLILMGAIWIGSWFAQSVTGWSEYNSNQLSHSAHGTSWIGYLGTPDFWEATLQNWQSEFLAVGSMAIFAVYLRQRGSPESKPVGAPHDETATEG